MRAEAKPAAKLLTFGFSEGRYRKPEPDECGGIMKMSYFPGGNPDPFGCSPCGGGGGGFIVVVWCYTSSEGCVPAQTDVMYKTKAAISVPVLEKD